jgi:hypothetical protein
MFLRSVARPLLARRACASSGVVASRGKYVFFRGETNDGGFVV